MECVNRYIENKEYEKALSLLSKVSISDEEHSALLRVCKEKLIEDCSTQINHFVQIKDKAKAEEVVEKYISLIGTDDNVTQWRTQIDNILLPAEMQTTPVGESNTSSDLGEKENTKLSGDEADFRWINRVESIFVKCILIFICVVLIIIWGVGNYKENKEKKRYMAEQQAYEDSVAAAERAYNDPVAVAKRAEAARRAAIEKAKRDSIAAIEKARRDSIEAVERARKEAEERAEHIAFAKKYSKLGLMIREVEMTRGKDRDGDNTKGIKFEIFNPTNKTIKYVVAYVSGINGVGDVTTGQKGCRGIGPIEPYGGGSWDFDDVLYDKNDIIVDLRVSFQVIYKNGTSKTVRVKDALYKGWFDANWFLLE